MKPYKLSIFLLSFFCLISWLPTGLAAANTIKWYSYDEGLKVGKTRGKKIFITFRADWCGYCRKMEKETFKDPSVVSFLSENFISIKVDTDRQKKIALEYRVMGLPSSWFLWENGEPIGNLPGYSPPAMFLETLKSVKKIDKKSQKASVK